MTLRILRGWWPGLAIVAIGLALAGALLTPGKAGAHAVLERSLPVQDQKLAEPPELVEAWFSEPLERSLTSLRVLDRRGEPVHVGETFFNDDESEYAAVALPLELPPGIYTVTYENVSTVDGHVWSGFFSFIVLNADESVPEGEALVPGGLAGQTGLLPGNVDSALRWIGLLAAAALAGGVFFALIVARPAAEFLSRERAHDVSEQAIASMSGVAAAAALLMTLTTLGQLLLFADRVGRLDDLAGILFETRSGELLAARMGLGLALALLFLPGALSEEFRRSRHAVLALWPALIGGLGLMITFSLGSHSASGGGQFWSITSDFVHFAATAAWIGALVQLPLLFRWAGRQLDGAQRVLYLANALDRFSWLSVISIALVIGTGVFNGFVQLPTFESFYETTFGRVLMVKMALILPLLAVAGFNAIYVRPRLVETVDTLHDEDVEWQPSGSARERQEARLRGLERLLPRTAIAELLLAVAVLASVAVLAQSTTVAGELRLDASRPDGEFVASGDSRDLDVLLEIRPFGIGINTFTATVTALEGEELGEILGLRLTASLDDPNVSPSAGRSGTNLELEPTETDGVWSADAVLMTQPGTWNIQARVQRRGFDDADASFTVTEVGGYLARPDEPEGLFSLPFTYVDWNIVAGGGMLVLGVGVFLIWRHRPPSWRRSTSVSIGFSSAAALLTGIVFLFGVHAHEAVDGNDSPIPATAESLAIGQGLFTTNCATCHGNTGTGDGPAAATLAVPPSRLGDHVPFHSARTIFLWISGGIPLDAEQKTMPAFGAVLSDEERWHLVNFLKETFKAGDIQPIIPEDLAQSER